MGAIEDTRKVLQDFLAPELRAISARLDALEQRSGDLGNTVAEVDRSAERRHDQVLAAIDRLTAYNEIRDRVARLEARDNPHQ